MRFLFAAALIVSLASAAFAQTREPWQLGHGPFVTASDVREHSKLGQDIADLKTALAGAKPDWAAAITVYSSVRNFPNHTLAIFADDYNGRLATYLPAATKHFGHTKFQNSFFASAFFRSGAFRNASDAERRATIEGAAIALVLNWCRYELGESERKAKMPEPNWALTNGSPKNWNEVFAFYYGPDGKHAGFEAVAAVEGGASINERMMAALAEGQKDLVGKKWAPDAARRLASTINAASLALLRDALKKAADAPDDQLAAARARAAGLWLGAVEIVARDPARAKTVEAAFSGKPGRAAITTARAALENVAVD